MSKYTNLSKLTLTPFVIDKRGELLLLALTARNSGVRASSLLNLSELFSESVALDFDFACTSRLRIYDTEREVTENIKAFIVTCVAVVLLVMALCVLTRFL